jgi:hypothetical protein
MKMFKLIRVIGSTLDQLLTVTVLTHLHTYMEQLMVAIAVAHKRLNCLKVYFQLEF